MKDNNNNVNNKNNKINKDQFYKNNKYNDL